MIPTFRRVVARQHHVYQHYQIDDIVEYLGTPPLVRGAMAKIARDTGIPRQTLSDWHQARMRDPNWFPSALGHPRARALSESSEASIADFVRVNYITPGLGATRTALHDRCMDAYAAQADDERHRDRFSASTTFLRDFQKRQRLSLRTPHRERRTTVDPRYSSYYQQRLKYLSSLYPPNMIFNMDETCWRLFETPRKVVAQTGTESVKVSAPAGEKTCFTALATISAAGDKLPLWVLAKGKTAQCEVKFGTHPNILVRHTESGWATEDIILSYIEWLSREVAQGCPCVLVLDVYSTHRTGRVLLSAAEKDMEILLIPAGGTAQFQPLDRRVFGELKARARAEFGRMIWRAGEPDITYDQSVEVLGRCWDAIPIENIRKAWDIQ
jgi:hypothetical protein